MYDSQVNYVVQEAVVVIRDIFRKYPGQQLPQSWGRLFLRCKSHSSMATYSHASGTR